MLRSVPAIVIKVTQYPTLKGTKELTNPQEYNPAPEYGTSDGKQTRRRQRSRGNIALPWHNARSERKTQTYLC